MQCDRLMMGCSDGWGTMMRWEQQGGEDMAMLWPDTAWHGMIWPRTGYTDTARWAKTRWECRMAQYPHTTMGMSDGTVSPYHHGKYISQYPCPVGKDIPMLQACGSQPQPSQ